MTAAATTNTPPNIHWLAVAVGPPNTTSGTILTVTAVPTGLSAGVYSGQITVSASGDSSVPSQVIPVTYTITTPYVPPPVSAPQITSGCPVSPVAQNSFLTQTLLATGGGGSYTWILAGTLPAGLSLTENTISGTVTAAPGVYNFGIDVSSGGQYAGVACSLNVTPPKLQITSVCPGNGTVGVAYGPFTLGATGGLGGTTYQFSIVNGSLPVGIGLSGNVISGTPRGPPGTSTFSIQVSSGMQTATAGPCSVTIASTLTITGTCPKEAQAGVLISVPVSVTGGMPSYTFSFTGSSGLGYSNGTVSGTISAAGTASFSLTVNDSAKSPPQTLSCSFPVTAQLQITGTCPAAPVAQGVALSLPLAGSGGTPPYSWSVSGPSWLSAGARSGSGISVGGTPPTSGSFSFSVTLTDSLGASAQAFSCTLTVKPVLQITPSASCPASPLAFQSTFSLSFTALNGTAPYTWAYNGPSWLSLSTTSGSTTTLKGSASVAGTFPFTVTLNDSAGSIQATFSCTVTVSAPAIPTSTLTGSIPTQNLTSSGATVSFSLAAPAPVDLTATLQLTFTQNVTNQITDPADYPLPTFSTAGMSGCTGTTCTFAISQGNVTPMVLNLEPGVVAGTIHVALTSLRDSVGSVLPANPPSVDLVVPQLAPVLTSGCFANQTSTGYNILIAGYSTPRDMSSATVTFTAAPGTTIQGQAQFTEPVSSQFTSYYQTPARSTAVGSSFSNLTIPVSVSGDNSGIATVTVTLMNSVGQSAPITITTCSN